MTEPQNQEDSVEPVPACILEEIERHARYVIAEGEALADLRTRGATPEATAALIILAQAIIAVVKQVDLDHNVGEYFDAIKVIAYGPGRFSLNIESTHLDIDKNRLRDAVQTAMAAQAETSDAATYGKKLRNIEIRSNTE